MSSVLHEYGNRDWAGLTSDYYMPRWQMYFDSLSNALATGTNPEHRLVCLWRSLEPQSRTLRRLNPKATPMRPQLLSRAPFIFFPTKQLKAKD